MQRAVPYGIYNYVCRRSPYGMYSALYPDNSRFRLCVLQPHNYLVSTHLGTILQITCLHRSTTMVSAISLKSRDHPPKNTDCALVELLQVTPQVCSSLAGMDSGSVTCSEGEHVLIQLRYIMCMELLTMRQQ